VAGGDDALPPKPVQIVHILGELDGEQTKRVKIVLETKLRVGGLVGKRGNTEFGLRIFTESNIGAEHKLNISPCQLTMKNTLVGWYILAHLNSGIPITLP
jgi:hypothetical protein